VKEPSPAYWRITFDNPPLSVKGPQFVQELREITKAIEDDGVGSQPRGRGARHPSLRVSTLGRPAAGTSLNEQREHDVLGPS
jgi:hypothetical protein